MSTFSDRTMVATTALAILLTATQLYRSLRPAPHPVVRSIRTVERAERYAVNGLLVGLPAAKVHLVEFSDFQCPFCKRLHLALDSLQAQHPNDVAILFRHFPLTNHPRALPAAIASECAARAGVFRPFALSVFTLQDSLGAVTLDSIARRVGITDMAAFRQCQKDTLMLAAIDRDVRAGTELELHGTPGLIINGELIEGALPLDSLERRLGLSRAQ